VNLAGLRISANPANVGNTQDQQTISLPLLRLKRYVPQESWASIASIEPRSAGRSWLRLRYTLRWPESS
jgi:hypothetical protein